METGCQLGHWTDWFKDPEGLGTCLLTLGKVPSFIIIGIGFIFFVSAWREFGRKRVKEFARARGMLRERTTIRQRAAVGLCVSGAAVLVATYVLSCLSETMFSQPGGVPSIFDQMYHDQEYVVGNPVFWVTGSPHWTYVTSCAVVAAAAVAILLVYARVTRSDGMRRLSTAMIYLFNEVISTTLR